MSEPNTTGYKQSTEAIHENSVVILYIAGAMMSGAGLATLYPAGFVVAIAGVFALVGLLVNSYQQAMGDRND
jgi:hypothetical protein